MISRRYPWTIAAAGALLLPLLWASAAQAISLIKVREVYAGTNNDSYVELEAYSSYVYAGDTIPGKSLILFDDEGNPTVRFTFNKKDQNGTENTRFLVADTGTESSFGVVPDIVDPQMKIDSAGGAACWNVGDTPVDCVAWGAFSGQAALQAYAGTGVGNPAFPGGIPAGKAIERTESPNCPTWLEGEDDTDDSATDFLEATPSPQSTQIWDSSEYRCESGMPDDTAILEKPPSTSSDDSPHFEYSATGATSFQCKLDDARFITCSADGVDYSNIADGSHTFLVRALNANGPDASPAQYTWVIDTHAPAAAILTHPGATSFGRSASFTFSSSEPGSTFLCSLDSAPASPCRSGITLTSLASGTHTFSVAAIDAAGNVQTAPTSYTWTVDANPAVTTIDGKPDTPTASPLVTFTYHASRPDAVFECSMDGAQYSSCPNTGATYTGLADGTHTFKVLAVDSDGDVEASPPSYTFTVGAAPHSRICKKGYRKKVVRGATRCTKIRRHHKHRRS
jgi:hypothetical protein